MAAETFVFNIADKFAGKTRLPDLPRSLLEEQQFHNQELTVWLGNLREVFYDAQDVLDEFECEALRRQDVETRGSTTRKVRRFFSSSNSLVFRTKMGHQIKDIRVRLDEVAADRAKFHLSERSENRHVVRGREMSYSFVQASDVIGRDQDKENILQLLMHPAGDQNVSSYFCSWDWREKWIELRNLLMGGANGSKILVTTRSPRTASMMGTVSPYDLKGLPHKECMSLFVKCAFDEGQVSRHANLVEIGDEIVKKCKGVPLGVKSLGSLLYSKLEEPDWLFVKDNDLWKLNKKEESLFEWMQGYTCLQVLIIIDCGGLISLFSILKCLTALEVLAIRNCEKVDLTEGEDNQEEFTMSLRAVFFWGLPQLVALPQWIKWFSRTLQSMTIVDCPNLTVLPEWLPNLASLKTT
uniref:Disease resistance N-terminal domain-containing protein n=1 Tax=Fagus sylvatica TaxID=28930 RepID=A0A2N9HTV1_FAGSY